MNGKMKVGKFIWFFANCPGSYSLKWTILIDKGKSPSGWSDREYLPPPQYLKCFFVQSSVLHMASSCSIQGGPIIQTDGHFCFYGLQSSLVSKKASTAEGLQGKQKQQHQDFWVHKESSKPHNIDIICCYAFFPLQLPLTDIAVLCLNSMITAPQTFDRFIYQQNMDNLFNKNSGNIFHLGLCKGDHHAKERQK